MKRFKNYGLWVAVAALVGMILQDAGVSITPEKYDAYVNAILTVLVLAGIVNNPTSGRGFKDEE
jgi:uncharacterized membrane protein